jgi:hypothetical protein
VFFLDEDELFNYYGEAFVQKFEEEHRQGHTEPTDKTHSFDEAKTKTNTDLTDGTDKKFSNTLILDKEKDPSNPSNPCSEEKVEENLCYHGIEYKEICEAWQTAQGGAPATGDRHRTMLQLALDLRYICDNQPEVVDRVLRLCGFVQDVIRERGDKEVTDIAHTACERKLYKDIPKRMQGVLESVGIHTGKPDGAAKSVGAVEVPYEQFAERLEPLLCAPYAEACKGVSRHNWLGAVMASGAMYCTLMTRCWYKHFNGARQILIFPQHFRKQQIAKQKDHARRIRHPSRKCGPVKAFIESGKDKRRDKHQPAVTDDLFLFGFLFINGQPAAQKIRCFVIHHDSRSQHRHKQNGHHQPSVKPGE